MTLTTTTMLNRKRYSPGGAGETHYYIALEKIRSRLKRKGPINTAEAWRICGGNYGVTATIFSNIMQKMISEGAAIKEGKGKYNIIRAGVEFTAPDPGKREARIMERISAGVAPWYSRVYGCWMTPCKSNEP